MDSLNIVSLLLIAISVSIDCFAVAFSASVSGKFFKPVHIVRMAFMFGFFQALMPFIGWAAGSLAVDLIDPYGYWLAFGLLAFIGGKMMYSAVKGGEDSEKVAGVTSFLTLMVLSIATSIDALAVGVSFAFLEVNIVLAISVIGFVSFLGTILGFLVGNKAGYLLGQWAEVVGGLVLIAIGISIVAENLLS